MDQVKMLQKILRLETFLTNGQSNDKTKYCLRLMSDDELRNAFKQLKGEKGAN